MINKTKLIPFNWDKYQAGAKAVLNNNRIISIINSNIDELYPIHCIYEEAGESSSSCFRKNGMWLDEESLENDLFLEEELEEKTFYVNIYAEGHGKVNYETFEEAEKSAPSKGILKVTYTGEDLIK